MGAFKATLEELQDADLLLHLVDCSNPRFEEQIRQVEEILDELDLGGQAASARVQQGGPAAGDEKP